MTDRLITVTNGTGAGFTKEEMLESEYLKKSGSKTQSTENAIPLQTEYESETEHKSAEKMAASGKTEIATGEESQADKAAAKKGK